MKEYQSYNESQQAQERTICQTMFPPTKEEADEFHLDRSFRILPHAQNSGGFFVAIIRKTQEFNSKLIVDVPQKFQYV
jgi:16S rRNA C967 or C1407 C5-methylase (RsmB/RsmF family)